MSTRHQSDGEMLKGTLDMMILRTLATGAAHGHTIAKVIERTSEDVLEVEQGSLYPALHRLEDRGWVSSYRVRARIIAERSFTGSAQRAEGNLPVKRADGGG
jgi:DNA-binding PadR family transcriptional regulator